MKEKEILKAMSDINDSYIEEAAENPQKMKEVKIKKAKTGWVKWAAGAAAAVVLVGAIGFGTLGFGRAGSAAPMEAASSTTAVAAPSAPAAAPAAMAGGMKAKDMAAAEEFGYVETEAAYEDSGLNYGNNATTLDTSSLDKKNVKLIYRADVYMQTTDFMETVDKLTALVDANGGYFENMSVNRGGYYNDNQDFYNGYYTVRIPQENYQSFISSVSSDFQVCNLSQNVEDIGLEYYETESRLKTLRTKEARLHELLEEAAGLADIIQLESALSDTEWQIDMYTSTLNRYDSLVGYSTININIDRVDLVTEQIDQDNSFGAKIGRAFKNGSANFVRGIQNFVIDITYSLFNIILTVVVIAAAILIIRAIVIKRRKKKVSNSQDNN